MSAHKVCFCGEILLFVKSAFSGAKASIIFRAQLFKASVA